MTPGPPVVVASSARRARFAIPLLAALCMATPLACGDRGTSAQPAIAWTSCGQRLECARVQVPLDWNRPNEAEITLAVIRHLASRPEQRIGSLFWNPGGPGGSLDRVRDEGGTLDAQFHGRFDIVGWDIRGSGESTHVLCFDSQSDADAFFRDWALPFTTSSSSRILE